MPKYVPRKRMRTIERFVKGLDKPYRDDRPVNTMLRNCCSFRRKTKFGWRYRLARKAEKLGLVVFDTEKWCFMCGQLRKVFVVPKYRG